MINVHIHTTCYDRDLFYGTALVFKTLRQGFPTSRITISDNASLREVRPLLRKLAAENDCRYEQFETPGIDHHNYIEAVLESYGSDNAPDFPLVFLDPDVILWDNCEGFEFQGLMAGKLINWHQNRATGTTTLPRLHSSFLWIPDPKRLMAEIRKIQFLYVDFTPFKTYSCKIGGKWFRFDTGANLYGALEDQMEAFTEDHFEYYDHLFGGCHFDILKPYYESEEQKFITNIHTHAKKGDLDSLKGIWREQAQFGY